MPEMPGDIKWLSDMVLDHVYDVNLIIDLSFMVTEQQT
jgi:hypothetical protein